LIDEFQRQELEYVRARVATLRRHLDDQRTQTETLLAYLLAECDVVIGDPVEYRTDETLEQRTLRAVQELRQAVLAMAN
jgi:transposase